MLDLSSTSNEIIEAHQMSGLKHTPPVNIDFEDIIYKIENGQESKLIVVVELNENPNACSKKLCIEMTYC